MKLREFLELRKTDGMFGVELEIEGKNLPDNLPAAWRLTQDGSLRGNFPTQAAEYVMIKPMSLASANLNIKRLTDHLQEVGAKPLFSHRTSLHVHVNCQELTWDEYSAFLYTSLLMERVLLNFCGQSRVGNRFCLRVTDAEGYLDDLRRLFRNGFRYFITGGGNVNKIKYSSINVAPSKEYGSVEFRGMRGTVDRQVITAWIEALNSIRSYAVARGSVEAVHASFIQDDINKFISDVLGAAYKDLSYKGMENDVRMCHSVLIELPYNVFKEKNEEAVGNAPRIQDAPIPGNLNPIYYEPVPIVPRKGRLPGVRLEPGAIQGDVEPNGIVVNGGNNLVYDDDLDL